jgi:hypothetical protein
MPGRPRRIPSYCRHKASGQAYLTLGGREVYLGVYGSPESHEKYARLTAGNYPNGPYITASPRAYRRRPRAKPLWRPEVSRRWGYVEARWEADGRSQGIGRPRRSQKSSAAV